MRCDAVRCGGDERDRAALQKRPLWGRRSATGAHELRMRGFMFRSQMRCFDRLEG